MPKTASITYTLHPSPSSSSTPSSSQHALQGAIEGIRSHLPLRNLHWKSASRTSLRTIQELEIDLVELGEVSPVRELGAKGVLEVPLVNLCLVVCEDAETYKNTTRNFLRDWLSLLAARRTVHAPLIVLVNPGVQGTDPKTGLAKGVWGKDKGVLGKIKGDYNSGKRDRCVQLNLPPPGMNDPAAWPELINKLKESLITAFDGAIIEREEEVKRGEAQRMMVGWNFCTWFLLKESLAHSFEGVGLNEDALIVYEELEAAFFQILKEQNLSWLNRLGATSPKDDSLPILDPGAKPYRELLQHSSISIFDFRIYLFARQGQLLGKLGRITEIAKRGQWFVASLTRRLRENESDLADHFVESWTYTASMDIVLKCDQWSQLDRPNGDYSGLIAYESARSELLDIARIQVERIGVAAGHLPDQYPFKSASSPYNPGETDDVLFDNDGLSDDEDDQPPIAKNTNTPTLSNRHILDAQADPNVFQSLYLDMTRKAVMAYEACGKVNSVVRLKADLAAMALHSKDYPAAYDLCRSLAKTCADLHTWERVASFALEGALRAHRELEKDKDEDWTNLALAYLRVCAISPMDIQGGTDGGEEELKGVLEGLKGGEEKHDVEGHRAFGVKMLVDQASLEDNDRTAVEVELNNALSVDVQIETIALDLIDSQGELITFLAEDISLRPGKNTLQTYCSTSTQGLCTLNSATISLGAVNFSYNKLEEGMTLKVMRDTRGVDVKLRMPYSIKLDDETKVVLEIRGNSPMRDIRLSLRSVTPEVGYVLESAQSNDEVLEYSSQSGFLTLPDLDHGVREVIIPYMGVPQNEVARAQIVLEYESSTGTREWIDVQSLYMGLPLTVNVQDFFRPECLLSHFTIASDGKQYLRIASVNLRTEGSFDVEACKTKWEDAIIVTPRQPLSTLFRIKRKPSTSKVPTSTSTSQDNDSAPLRLSIKYRSLEEEMINTIDNALRSLDSTSPERGLISRIARQFLAEKSRWLQPYLAGGQVRDILISSFDTKTKGVETFLSALESKDDYEVWRTLEIPVDVPQRRLLTTVRMTPQHSSKERIYEGRAISLDMKFTTSYAWAGDLTASEEHKDNDQDGKNKPILVYDVQGSEDWLVLGKKKGYYIADSTVPETTSIVLIPLRAGNLFLPTISIHFDPSNQTKHQSEKEIGWGAAGGGGGMMCETYVENAAERINVLPAKKEVGVVVPIMEGGWDREAQREIY